MIKLDERGNQCPLPVINTKKVLEKSNNGEVIEVIVDNEIAVQNLNKLAVQKKCGFFYKKESDSLFIVNITVGNMDNSNKEVEALEYVNCNIGSTAVAIASATMGVGDEALGKILMKGFIFALTQLESLPSEIIFYNGGASLTCEGSDSLPDLINLQNDGVKIYTCGTCLNHYGISEKLKVGEVTNMYNIVEMLNKAGRVIKP